MSVTQLLSCCLKSASNIETAGLNLRVSKFCLMLFLLLLLRMKHILGVKKHFMHQTRSKHLKIRFTGCVF